MSVTAIDAHDSWCATNGVCGARDLRGGGAWHSNEPEGRGGFVIVLADSTEFIPRGACPVFR